MKLVGCVLIPLGQGMLGGGGRGWYAVSKGACGCSRLGQRQVRDGCGLYVRAIALRPGSTLQEKVSPPLIFFRFFLGFLSSPRLVYLVWGVDLHSDDPHFVWLPVWQAWVSSRVSRGRVPLSVSAYSNLAGIAFDLCGP